MKQTVLRSAFCLMCLFFISSAMKAQDVNVFLGDFETFVDNFVKTDTLNDVQLDSIRAKYSDYKEQYTLTYKSLMTDKQLNDYTAMKARYDKKMASFNTGKVLDKVDSVAVKVGRAIKRKGSQVSGYVKGTFTGSGEKSDSKSGKKKKE